MSIRMLLWSTHVVMINSEYDIVLTFVFELVIIFQATPKSATPKREAPMTGNINHNGTTSEISTANLNYVVLDLHHWTVMYVGRGMQYDATHIAAFEDHINITCSYQWMLSLTANQMRSSTDVFEHGMLHFVQGNNGSFLIHQWIWRYPVFRQTSGLSRFLVISGFFLYASVHIPVIDNETTSASRCCGTQQAELEWNTKRWNPTGCLLFSHEVGIIQVDAYCDNHLTIIWYPLNHCKQTWHAGKSSYLKLFLAGKKANWCVFASQASLLEGLEASEAGEDPFVVRCCGLKFGGLPWGKLT